MKIVIFGDPKLVADKHGDALTLLGAEAIYVNPDKADEILESAPDAVLLGLEWAPSWRILAAKYKRAGIPLVYLMDGVIEWSYIWNNQSYVREHGTVLQPLISDALCVVGRHPARILAALGLATRIHIVGLPRFDGLRRVRIRDREQKPTLVVATARTWGHNVEQRLSVLRGAGDLARYLRGREECNVVWRVAPEVAKEIGVTNTCQGPLSDALATASALITFPSTCLLEGMAFGVPTALVEYRPVPLYLSASWEIRSQEHIAPVVQELLYPPAEKMAYQEACFEDELEPGNASERLAQLIRSEVDGRAHIERSGQATGIFPPLDFRNVHSQVSTFAMHNETVLQYELDGAYATIEALRRIARGLSSSRGIRALKRVAGALGSTRLYRLLDELARF